MLPAKTYLIASLIALSSMAPVQAMSAKQSVLKEVRTLQPDGGESISYEEATLVTPGEVVVYRLDFVNDGAEPVTDMVLTMPVPREVVFQAGSAASADTQIVYSTDNGTNFSSWESLSKSNVDGSRVAASAEDVTHIRWTFDRDLEVGEKGALRFKGRLK